MPRSRVALLWAGLGAVLVVAIVLVTLLVTREPEPEVAIRSQSPTPTVTRTPTPAPSPTPTGAPADPTAYDAAAFPRVDVFAILPGLPTDDSSGAFTGETARAVAEAIPVFAAPSTTPVAALARDQQFDGTTVPIIERQEHWVKVLLPGRHAVPSQGDPAQLSGWLRAQDVEIAALDARVEVSISARTVEIVRGTERELVASDFGWGTDATPTPVGRAFIMTTAVVPEYGYTRGNPIVYLSVQSPTLDGFGGADAAVTAFHYHDSRSGSISNGCLRVDAQATERLAALPLGTPVSITP